MKLLKSIGRELTLLSRSYYFYIEIGMAVLYLVILLVVMPENMSMKSTEYLYFDMPPTTIAQMEASIFPDDGSIIKENTTLKVRGNDVSAMWYITDTKDVYVLPNEETLIALCEDSGNIGYTIGHDGNTLTYHYYLQGYETAQFKNLAVLISSSDVMQMTELASNQTVTSLAEGIPPLNDRQNMLSILLVVNCALMGVLIMAAYIFEDKKTNMINAVRVTPTPMRHYLIAKMSAVLLTASISALVVALPIMGGNADYLSLLCILLCSGFFTIAVGSFMASFFKDLEGAFAAVFVALIVLLVPAISTMIPTWNAGWLQYIPSYWAILGTQNALLRTNHLETWVYCGGFLVAGILVFLLSLYRYQNKEASGI